jgi:hypothetical protein
MTAHRGAGTFPRVAHTCRRLACMRSWHPAMPLPVRQCIPTQLPRGRIDHKTTYAPPAASRTISPAKRSKAAEELRRSARPEECNKSVRQGVEIEGLAFPDDQDVPTKSPQLCLFNPVSFDVAPEFFRPIRRTSFGAGRTGATAVAMPETSMDEYRLSQSREH